MMMMMMMMMIMMMIRIRNIVVCHILLEYTTVPQNVESLNEMKIT